MPLAAPKRKTECGDQLLEIWEGDAARGPSTDFHTLKHIALRMENRDITVVVENEYLDRQALAGDCLQLLHVHHDTAVAGKTDDWLIAGCLAGPYRGGEI